MTGRTYNAGKRSVSRAEFDALRGRVDAMEATLSTISNDTHEILALVKKAQGVGGFVAKHAPRAFSFALGLMIAAEIGNPKVIAFLQNFFA